MSEKKFLNTKTALIDYQSAAIAAEEIEEFLSPNSQLTEEEAWEIYDQKFGYYRKAKFIEGLRAKGKSAGARYIAARIYSGESPDNMAQLCKDWWSHRAIKNAITDSEFQEIGATAGDFRRLGIRFGWEARRFYDLYSQLRIAERPFGSEYQLKTRVLRIATTPNYNRLPLWAKKGLLRYGQLNQERIGNVWRLLPCVKAWKWNSSLPKKIAERIGQMPVRSRMLAGIAWEVTAGESGFRSSSSSLDSYRRRSLEDENSRYDRETLVSKFWQTFRCLNKKSPVASLKEVLSVREQSLPRYCQHPTRVFVEVLLNLPYGSLEQDWKEIRDTEGGEYLDEPEGDPESIRLIESLAAEYGTAKDSCLRLFGVAGKRTQRLLSSTKDSVNWKWAAAIAYGNADAVQKVLSMNSIIEWEPEAVDFLLSLPMQARLRLLQKTTFKYRRGTYEVSRNHIRDTGYLWKNIAIAAMPDLGRIRCWFSIHETLAAAFVEQLPDEPLPIPQGWDAIDGLCSINGDWSLHLPKSVDELKYYGKSLNNCVGGYGPAIKSGRSVIVGVRERGILTHCIEVSGGRIQQFYAAGNSPPMMRLEAEIQTVLKDFASKRINKRY